MAKHHISKEEKIVSARFSVSLSVMSSNLPLSLEQMEKEIKSAHCRR